MSARKWFRRTNGVVTILLVVCVLGGVLPAWYVGLAALTLLPLLVSE